MRKLVDLSRRCAVTLGWTVTLALGGCSGGGGGGGSGASEAGIELPSEISAVSSASSEGGVVRAGRAARQSVAKVLGARLERAQEAVADLPPDSDYHTVKVRRFVEIEVLDIFDIIDQIFDAIRQTNYADAANVGRGWYKCMVAFEDEGEGGVTTTTLEEWYVRSRYVGTVNRLEAKIVETDSPDGGERLILVQADIEQAPTENEDGTLANLGVWTINASFTSPGVEPDGESFFHATATVTEGGASRLTIEDRFIESFDGEEFAASTRAVIYRSQGEGYGVAEYPNWDACFGPGGADCSAGPPTIAVLFAYNANYLSIEVDGESLSFDRLDEHEIVHRYKLFNSTDGSDVERTRSFGFPVRLEQEGGSPGGWYGAWQDRHQLWVGGSQVADGATCVRADVPGGQEPPSYTTRVFSGALTRVELVAGSLDQVEGIPAEIHLHNILRLRWNEVGGRWDQCLGDDGVGGCETTEDFTDKLASLEVTGDADQKFVNINHFEFSELGPSETRYVYLSVGPAGADFYEAELNPETGRLESTGVPLDEAAAGDGYELFCSVSGRAYIQYTGDFDGPETTTGWVEKSLTSFDSSTWTPVFDDNADREFIFELGRSYFVSNRGANFRVVRLGETGTADDYAVYMEVNTVAKPSDSLDAVYPDGTVLVDAWDPGQSSTYALNTDPGSENYLLLEYLTVSERDEGEGIEAGQVVTRDLWGLRVQGDETAFGEAIFFNWTYQDEGESWGGVTYLVDAAGAFVLLSDPIRLEPIALASTDDIVNERPEEEWVSYSLAFDGHLHGLPDTWWELRKVDFDADKIPAALAKNVRIPDGTEVTDADGGSTYYVKAVDAGIFLGYVTAFPAGEEPDMTPAEGLDLDAELPDLGVPDLSPDVPADAPLLYIEGLPLE